MTQPVPSHHRCQGRTTGGIVHGECLDCTRRDLPQNMTGIDSNKIAKMTLPFFGCMILAIVLITVFPEIVTSVPNWVMGQEI